jgi:release factor glutamine methyltransferase
MTIGDWYQHSRKELPTGEALLLLSFVLRKDKAAILTHPEYLLSDTEGALLEQYLTRRKNHEPLAYITGEKEFFGLPFLVTKDTLIPRPETEILVEYVLGRIQNLESGIWNEEKKISMLDIGTGSGCIPISIGKTLQSKHPDIFSNIQFLATDISSDALSVARRNATHHGMEQSIAFRHSNLLSDIPTSYFHTPDFILTANLPYLSKKIYHSSPEDVRLYEPKSALQGDEHDGTTPIMKLLEQCARKITPLPKAHLFILEISPEQGEFLLLQGKRFFPQSTARLLPDLSSRNRFLIIENR